MNTSLGVTNKVLVEKNVLETMEKRVSERFHCLFQRDQEHVKFRKEKNEEKRALTH